MLKGGFPPIYPIDKDNNLKTTDNIKRNFSSNNIININSILLKKNNNLTDMLKSSDIQNVESESNNDNNNKEKKKKKRNFKNNQLDEDFFNYINDLNNIKQISRIKKSSKKSSKK
jgi:hypothetical protein